MDVETCRFFPSGVVILTGGSDMRLKIWSAEKGTCPRTLVGHTGGQISGSGGSNFSIEGVPLCFFLFVWLCRFD